MADEEEGNLPGLDLSDSDDDATWTPFRNKEDRERPVGVPNVLNQGTNLRNLITVLFNYIVISIFGKERMLI